MKRALYIGGFTMPDGNAAAQRVLGIAKLLRLCDFDVRFCGLIRRTGNKQTASIDNFEYVNYPYPDTPASWLRYLTGYDFSISEIDSYNPDIVILYNHPALATERIIRHCRKKNIKVIADVTEWYDPKGNILFKIIKQADTNRRMRHSLMKADGLICISKYLSDYYCSFDMPVAYIPPLVDLKQPKWHQTTNNTGDTLRIVYAGSPGSSKDRIDMILNSLDRITDKTAKKIQFDIIGLTDSQYAATWNDTTNRDYASFHGRIPHEKAIAMLLNADFQIFFRPDNIANRAGFPTKFVETIASGTLPITNLNYNLNEYINDGENGFIAKTIDPSDIEDAMLRAFSSDFEGLKQRLDVEMFDFHRYHDTFNKFINLLI